jgi:hypothetical protein
VENLTIITLDAEKAFGKIQYALELSAIKARSNLFNLIKDSY